MNEATAPLALAFDSHDAGFRADPYPTYRMLRLHSPVHYRADRGDWIITRYADNAALLRDPRLGSRPRAEDDDYEIPPHAKGWLSSRKEGWKLLSLWFVNRNPPDHTSLRKLFQAVFVPGHAATLRARVQALTDSLIDQVMPQGRMDILHDLAHRLSFTIIADIIGIPEEAHPTFNRLGQELTRAIDFDVAPSVKERAWLALMGLTKEIRTLIARWRVQPPAQDNLLYELLRAHTQGHLSEEELLAQCSFIFFAGRVTPAHLIGNGMLALLRHPDQLQMLRAQPGLMETAINELLRYDSPGQVINRSALAEVEIADTVIREGQTVHLVLGSANRDPAAFRDPDRLDIKRHPNPHLSFGEGLHYCIGASLAKLQAEVAINTLLRRVSHLRLQADTLQWEETFALHGLKSLPVVFE